MTSDAPAGWSLDGRVAIVAGGAGGIGSAVAARLASAGARVLVVDRVAGQVAPGIESVTCDLTDSAAAAELARDVVDRHGRLDVVVHAAGVTKDSALARMTDEEWRAVMAVNVDSAFYLLRASATPMRESGGGSIVLVSSINGERGKAGQANYAASKGALNALARTAAREWGRHRIRVNVVAPGWIETAMTAGLADALRQRALEETALARLGRPDDVADAVWFLCADASRHITGQVLRVDGGQLIG
jgi:acetoacetyl-CoA reductase/3-oxoacyl-[acyl-carrier protein] reductase